MEEGRYMTKEQQIVASILGNKEADNIVESVIAKYAPSVHTLKIAFNVMLKGKFGVIDTQNKSLVQKCKKAYEMKEEGKSDEQILTEISEKVDTSIKMHTRVKTDDSGYGDGMVEKVFSDGNLCLVRFEKQHIPIMCSINTKSTVHLAKGNIKIRFV